MSFNPCQLQIHCNANRNNFETCDWKDISLARLLFLMLRGSCLHLTHDIVHIRVGLQAPPRTQGFLLPILSPAAEGKTLPLAWR